MVQTNIFEDIGCGSYCTCIMDVVYVLLEEFYLFILHRSVRPHYYMGKHMKIRSLSQSTVNSERCFSRGFNFRETSHMLSFVKL